MYVYIALPRYETFFKSTPPPYANFFVLLKCNLHFEDVVSVIKKGNGHDFQHIHDPATRVVQPSAKCYLSRLLRKPQLGYCADRDLKKRSRSPEQAVRLRRRREFIISIQRPSKCTCAILWSWVPVSPLQQQLEIRRRLALKQMFLHSTKSKIFAQCTRLQPVWMTSQRY